MSDEFESLQGRHILVLDGDLVSALTVVRSLARQKCRVTVASAAARPLSTYSRSINGSLRYPDPLADSKAFVQWLEQITLRTKFDLVIPVSERTLVPIATLDGHFGARIAMAPRAALEKVLDKWQTLSLAETLKIPVPTGHCIRSMDDLEDVLGGLTYPVVVKPSRSVSRSEGDQDGGKASQRTVSYARDARILRRMCERQLQHSALILQSYFDGCGVGVELIAREGAILYTFQHRRLHEVPLTGGGSSFRVSTPVAPELAEAAAALIASLKWTGVAMVEFKWRPETAEFCLMEINGRFWGSLPLAAAAGADFPAMLARLELTGSIGPTEPYRVGIYCRNLAADVLWHELVVRAWLGDGPRALAPAPLKVLKELALTLGPRHRFDVQTLADPRPGLVECGRLLRRYWERAAGAISAHGFFLRQKLRWRTGEVGKAYRRADNILILCYGNINRSPVAEALLRRSRSPGKKGWIRSAGFHPEAGRPVDPRMQAVAGDSNVDLSRQRSRCLDAPLIREADIIFVMEKAHYDRLVGIYPAAARKTFLLGAGPGQDGPEIDDPYNRDIDVYRRCYGLIERAIAGLEGRGGMAYAAPGNP